MEAKHIDDRIPGENERIRAVEEAAREHARIFVYRGCQDCYKDVLVDSNTDDSASEEDDVDELRSSDASDFEEGDPVAEDELSPLSESIEVPEQAGPALEIGPVYYQDGIACNGDKRISEDRDQAPDQGLPVSDESSAVPKKWLSAQMPSQLSRGNISHPAPKRFLCHACEEEAAAKELECAACLGHFKALPSHYAYTAEEPICGQCFVEESWCSSCHKHLEPLIRSHYWIDDWDEHVDEEVPLCRECRLDSASDDDSVVS